MVLFLWSDANRCLVGECHVTVCCVTSHHIHAEAFDEVLQVFEVWTLNARSWNHGTAQ